MHRVKRQLLQYGWSVVYSLVTESIGYRTIDTVSIEEAFLSDNAKLYVRKTRSVHSTRLRCHRMCHLR